MMIAASLAMSGSATQEAAPMATSRYVPVEEASRICGVPYRTLARRVADGTIPTYKYDRDRRHKLVAIDEVARVFAPRPADTPQEVGPLSAA
jgi:hypothetical protein